MKRWAIVLVVCALAACGGGSGNKAASTSSTSNNTSSSSSSSSGGTIGAGDCTEASAALAAAGNFGQDSSGTGTLKDQAFKARDAMKTLAGAVSDSDTKDALNTLANAYNDFGNAAGDYDPKSGNPPSAAVIAALQAFGKPEFAQAASKLSQFFATGCH